MYGIIALYFNEMKDMPISKYERAMKDRMVALKVITNDRFDNEHLKIEYDGSLFATSIRRNDCARFSIVHKELQKKFGKDVDINKVYEIHIWNCSGSIGLYSNSFVVDDYDNPIPNETIKEIEVVLSDWIKGLCKCSDCSKKINYNDCKHHNFYASVFCEDCWIGETGKYKDVDGWKKREANENYD